MTLIIILSTIAASIGIDQITKAIVRANMTVGETIPIIKDIFHFTYVRNEGAAFGMLSEHRWVFMTLSSLMLVALTILLIIWDKPKPTFYVGTSMAIGGGIGNMIDRIAYGAVVDFIDFCAFPEIWHWIFNGADSFVCVGAAILIIYYISDFVVTSVKTHKVSAEVAAAENLESTIEAPANAEKKENEDSEEAQSAPTSEVDKQ